MTRADELAEALRREGAAAALRDAADIIQEAKFANADGYFRWLNDAAANLEEGKQMVERRPQTGLEFLLMGGPDPDTGVDSRMTDGSRVLRDQGWRPAQANSITHHELFQMTQGDWYCTGCNWAFGYRVAPERAQEVWECETAHKNQAEHEERGINTPPKMYLTEMRRRVDDNAEGDVSFGRDEMAHALDSYDLAIKELTMLRRVVEKVAMLPGQWVANSQTIAPTLDWSSWETRRQDARRYSEELSDALNPDKG